MAKVGDRVWVDDGMKVRPGVVMKECGPDLFLIIKGTGTARGLPRAEILERSRDGMAFPLQKPTYFFPHPLFFARAAAIKEVRGPCTKPKFFELEELLEAVLGVAMNAPALTGPPSATPVPRASSSVTLDSAITHPDGEEPLTLTASPKDDDE